MVAKRGTHESVMLLIVASDKDHESLRRLLAELKDDRTAWKVVAQSSGSRQYVANLKRLRRRPPLLPVEKPVTLDTENLYFLPPESRVELAGNQLRVGEHNPLSGQPNHWLDELLQSIGDSLGYKAIVVLLEHAADAGMLGLRAVHDAGGISLVEAVGKRASKSNGASPPDSWVDYRCHIDQIAEHIPRLLEHVRDDATSTSDELETDVQANLGPLCEVIEAQNGQNFLHYKHAMLVRRIVRRMQMQQLERPETYLEQLKQDPAEVARLVADFLIGVTTFFRDKQVFEHAKLAVLKPLFDDRVDEIKIWVPACSTGEEAYSWAMICQELCEQLEYQPQVKIIATDINVEALQTARRGLYSADIARHVSDARLQRFFVKRGGQYEVVREVREMCRFSRHNLVNDPPFSSLHLISCRNLLIYLGAHLQEKLYSLFHFALKAGGVLVLGANEQGASESKLFTRFDKKNRLFKRVETTRRSSQQWAVNKAESQPPQVRQATMVRNLGMLSQRIILDEFSPQYAVVDDAGGVVHLSNDVSRFLAATGGSNANTLFKMAHTGLRTGLRKALDLAVAQRRKVVSEPLPTQFQNETLSIRITVQPMPAMGNDDSLHLVVFNVVDVADRSQQDAQDAATLHLIRDLETELSAVQSELEATVTELAQANDGLKASNEELLSMNEELQAANDEMEASREEMELSAEALDRSRLDLENLLESTEIATLFVDAELCIQRFTPRMTDIYNLRDSDLGRPITDITHRLKAMPPYPSIGDFSDSAAPREEDVASHNGAFYLRRVLPYHDRSQVVGLIVTFIDVTEYREQQERLRLNEKRLSLLMNTIPSLVAYVDKKGRLVFANDAFTEWTHGAKGTAAKQDFADLFPADCRAILRDEVAHVQALAQVKFEIALPDEQGRSRDFLVQLTPNILGGKELLGFYFVAHDITDQKRQERRLLEADKQKDHYLANLAHELRNPLAPVQNAVAILKRNQDVAAREQRLLQVIARQVDHMGRLLDDLLDVSRVSKGKILLQKVPLDITELLDELNTDFQESFRERHIQFTVRLPGDPIFMLADTTRMRQVVSNLLHNALKFTPDGGQVELSAELDASAEQVCIKVTDSGCGMSANTAHHIFDAFYQGDALRDDALHGLGLGLALVRGLVELHQGSVQVYSKGEGCGTTFTLLLPALLSGIKDTADKVETVSGRDMRILVVDDLEDNADTIQMVLEMLGHKVAVAYNGEQAIELAASFKPDVLCSDIGLPDINGFEVVKRVRQALDPHPCYRAAITGFGQDHDVQQARQAGFHELLVKPVNTKQLESMLANAARWLQSGRLADSMSMRLE